MISGIEYMSMDDFPLKRRFTDPAYSVLPPAHLEQVHPLSRESARELWQSTLGSGLHLDFPFRRGFFHHIESIMVSESDGNEEEDRRIRKWLYRCAIPFDRRIFLSWQPDWAIETSWKIFVKYWGDFYYPISDDLTVCDRSLQWALLLYHEHEVFFGTNLPRSGTTEPSGAPGI